MNVSKILISCTAAMAVVGAIGLANAQSTDTTTPTTPATEQQMNNATVPATQDPAGAATGNTMGDTSNTELAPQADRN
jgi:hypothetical protein